MIIIANVWHQKYSIFHKPKLTTTPLHTSLDFPFDSRLKWFPFRSIIYKYISDCDCVILSVIVRHLSEFSFIPPNSVSIWNTWVNRSSQSGSYSTCIQLQIILSSLFALLLIMHRVSCDGMREQYHEQVCNIQMPYLCCWYWSIVNLLLQNNFV